MELYDRPRGAQLILCVLHAADVTGPAKTIEPRLRLLAEQSAVAVVLPGAGTAGALFGDFASVHHARYEVLVRPDSPVGLALLLLRQAGQAIRFTFLFARLRPKAVVVGSTLLPAAIVAARVFRRPTVVYAGELLHPRAARGDRAIARLVEACATRIVACSDAAGAAFRDAVVIRPGVNRPQPRDRAVARATLGVPSESFCVASVGSITRGRGQDVLLRAVAELAGETPCYCLVVGEPHPRAVDRRFATELEELADELGIAAQVRFTGFVDDVDSVYAAADVVVNPARFDEPFGRVAIEALAAGTPVVATTVGAIPEVLSDGRDSLLVPPDDPPALASALRRLRDDPGLRGSLVEGGAPTVALSDVDAGALAFRHVVEGAFDDAT